MSFVSALLAGRGRRETSEVDLQLVFDSKMQKSVEQIRIGLILLRVIEFNQYRNRQTDVHGKILSHSIKYCLLTPVNLENKPTVIAIINSRDRKNRFYW